MRPSSAAERAQQETSEELKTRLNSGWRSTSPGRPGGQIGSTCEPVLGWFYWRGIQGVGFKAVEGLFLQVFFLNLAAKETCLSNKCSV